MSSSTDDIDGLSNDNDDPPAVNMMKNAIIDITQDRQQNTRKNVDMNTNSDLHTQEKKIVKNYLKPITFETSEHFKNNYVLVEHEDFLYHGLNFNNDLHFILMKDGWYIHDTILDETINASSFKDNEIEHMIITAFHLAYNGRNIDHSNYGPKELLQAYTQASDEIRNGIKKPHQTFINNNLYIFEKLQQC